MCAVRAVCALCIELESCVQRIELLVANGIRHIVMALLTVYCGIELLVCLCDGVLHTALCDPIRI